jgi:hypothetical protein
LFPSRITSCFTCKRMKKKHNRHAPWDNNNSDLHTCTIHFTVDFFFSRRHSQLISGKEITFFDLWVHTNLVTLGRRQIWQDAMTKD